MDLAYALSMVESIIESHKDAVRVHDPRAVEVLDNAKGDISQLVRKIYSDCEDGDPANDGDADNVKLTQPYRPEDY